MVRSLQVVLAQQAIEGLAIDVGSFRGPRDIASASLEQVAHVGRLEPIDIRFLASMKARSHTLSCRRRGLRTVVCLLQDLVRHVAGGYDRAVGHDDIWRTTFSSSRTLPGHGYF